MKKTELNKQIEKLELRVKSYKEKANAINEQLLISERRYDDLLREHEQLKQLVQDRELLIKEVAMIEVHAR